MLKFLKKKLILSLIFIILIFFYYIVDLYFYKFQSIYFEKKNGNIQKKNTSKKFKNF